MFPAYPVKPHASGKARIRFRDKDGVRKDVYLRGAFGSPESKKHYAELAAQFATGVMLQPAKEDVTIEEAIVRWRSAAIAVRGEKSREVLGITSACTPLVRLFGSNPASSLDQKMLNAVREAMLSGSWLTKEEVEVRMKLKKPIGWCRSYTNHQVCRIRSAWRWVEFEGMAPKGSWDHLRSLPPIPPYRHVRQTAPVKAAEEASITKVIPHMPLMLAAMVQIQLLSGLRPGELVRMQANEIDELEDGTGEYRFEQHKNFWRHGQESVAVLPADAMAVLRPWLEAAKRRGKDSAIWCHLRGTTKPYTVEGFTRAIKDACEKADVPPFTSYQLRHACKRRVTRTHGLDAARAVLRQRSIATTDRYSAQADIDLAKKVAKESKRSA